MLKYTTFVNERVISSNYPSCNFLTLKFNTLNKALYAAIRYMYCYISRNKFYFTFSTGEAKKMFIILLYNNHNCYFVFQGATQATFRLLEGRAMLSMAGVVGPGVGSGSTTSDTTPSHPTGATLMCMVALQAPMARLAHQEQHMLRTVSDSTSRIFVLT